jgi:hypothetical protein
MQHARRKRKQQMPTWNAKQAETGVLWVVKIPFTNGCLEKSSVISGCLELQDISGPDALLRTRSRCLKWIGVGKMSNKIRFNSEHCDTLPYTLPYFNCRLAFTNQLISVFQALRAELTEGIRSSDPAQRRSAINRGADERCRTALVISCHVTAMAQQNTAMRIL